jgi:hypothetical protein
MRYLRQVRLDRARDDLAQAHGTVADIAYYWGFTNLSRFARAYRDRFGEFPPRPLMQDGPPEPTTKPRLARTVRCRCDFCPPARHAVHAPRPVAPSLGTVGKRELSGQNTWVFWCRRPSDTWGSSP